MFVTFTSHELVNFCRSIESLIEEFKKRPKCFFILTNSRALTSEKVKRLALKKCFYIEPLQRIFVFKVIQLLAKLLISLIMTSLTDASHCRLVH